jgi:pyruvate/2-oxoglutarate dehydrogenase complex dihydrolipoamide acyltransferase (E2) component
MGRQSAAGDEPDVVLDVSQLEVERITLEVDDLRAHVSILAELANLVSLSVGADVQLGRVKLEITGVKAKVLLEVRLEHVRAILEKALDTIAEHPEILGQTLSDVLRETLGTARATLEEALEGLEVGDTVDEALRGRLEEVRVALEDVLEGQEEGGQESGVPAEAVQNEVQATPAARRAAEELGVDLSGVVGTGTGGRITIRDVQNATQGE